MREREREKDSDRTRERENDTERETGLLFTQVERCSAVGVW